MSFDISCHLTFHVILHFMSFDISYHLTFHVILVILVIIEIIVTKVIMALMLKVVIKDRCVLKMWLSIYPLGHHHVKSSFGANNNMR